MEQFNLTTIGRISNDSAGIRLLLDKKYLLALTNLTENSYIHVIWWFNKCDNAASRNKLIERQPYKNAPLTFGTFATRSPERPNPIALTCSYVTYVDQNNGIIGLSYIDADHGTPVLDIKPYIPSLDRVETPPVPDWCAKWPDCIEKSGNFDWNSVFNF